MDARNFIRAIFRKLNYSLFNTELMKTSIEEIKNFNKKLMNHVTANRVKMAEDISKLRDRPEEKMNKILLPEVSIEAQLLPEGSGINNEKLTDELLQDLQQIADKYGLRLEMASVILYRYDHVPGTEGYECVECASSGIGVFDMRQLY